MRKIDITSWYCMSCVKSNFNQKQLMPYNENILNNLRTKIWIFHHTLLDFICRPWNPADCDPKTCPLGLSHHPKSYSLQAHHFSMEIKVTCSLDFMPHHTFFLVLLLSLTETYDGEYYKMNLFLSSLLSSVVMKEAALALSVFIITIVF